MNRIQTACFMLLASAFVLSGMLVLRLDQVSQHNAAMADQVIAQPQSFSLMTARTRGDDESLFVLDSTSGKLVVYTPNVGQQRLTVTRAFSLTELFGEDRDDRRRRGR